MKKTLVVLCGLFSTSLFAQQFEHCNALIDQGVTNITTELGEKYATAYNYYKYCRLATSEMSDTSARQASVSIFGYGSGGGNFNSGSMKKEIDSWCKENKNISSQSNKLFQESRRISSPALAAWNSCQEAAKKQVLITLTNRSENSEFLQFDIDSTADGTLYLTSVLQKGYSCSLSYLKDLKDFRPNLRSILSDGYEDISPNESIPIKNANMQITCQRTAPSTENVEGVGRISYESGSIAVNTTGPSFTISIPPKVEDYYFTPRNTVMAFTSEKCPAGWDDYKPAYGRFIRGIDRSGESIDPDKDRIIGSIQDDMLIKHFHTTTVMVLDNSIDGVDSTTTKSFEHNNQTRSTGNFGGAETRPKNVALLYCEKL